MARQNAIGISKRTVDALTVETGDAVFWDRELEGFGVRVYASGRKVYVVQMRGPTGSLKRITIGRDVTMTAETARRTAAEAIDRIRSGEDPFPAPVAPEATVAGLAARYMKAHVEVNCRPGAVEIFRRVLDLYIMPELGALRISAVERSHVSDLHFKMRDKPYQANQTVSVLAKMFKLAEAWGMTPPRLNPCRSVRRYKEHRRERFLSPEEYGRLGRVLDEAETSGRFLPSGIAAIRLLVLTGWPALRGVPERQVAQIGRRDNPGAGEVTAALSGFDRPPLENVASAFARSSPLPVSPPTVARLTSRPTII